MRLGNKGLSEFTILLKPTTGELKPQPWNQGGHPVRTGAASSQESARCFDMSADDRTPTTEPEATTDADVHKSCAEAKSSEPPTEAKTTTVGSVSGTSGSNRRWPRTFDLASGTPILD